MPAERPHPHPSPMSRRRSSAHHPAALLPPFDDEGRLTCVVETARGSRAKYRYDERTGTFTVAHVLAAGLAFPCEFAFVPGTRAGDGDPLDVLVLFASVFDSFESSEALADDSLPSLFSDVPFLA